MGSSYVLRDLKTGEFFYGRASYGLTQDLQQARVFSRKVDALNSLGQHDDACEVLPVFLSLTPQAAPRPAPTVKHNHPNHAEITARSNHGNRIRQL